MDEKKCKRHINQMQNVVFFRSWFKHRNFKNTYIYTHIYMYIYILKGFPGGPVVKNPPANSGDEGWGFNPWSGKISHATGPLSPCTTTTETHLPAAWALQQEKPPQWEALTWQLESSPQLLQLEKARAQQQRPSPVNNK